MLEGAVNEAISANWDGLIETALGEMTGDVDAVVRLVVLPAELRDPERPLTLLKFHGCAVRATREPSKYRGAIVATRPQITTWNTSADTKVIRARMVSLATTKPTFMIGLSAQDENIQRVFAEAKADMQWSWPTDPPAHVFAGDALGNDHVNLLRVVYGDDYDANADEIIDRALIPAYSKALLTALAIFVIGEKLRAYLTEVDAPLPDANREELANGIGALCHRMSNLAEPDRLAFIRSAMVGVRRALSLFRYGAEPSPASGSYTPLSSFPADRVKHDPALTTSGLRELAAALALLGRGEAEGIWSLGIGPVASGASGALTVTSGGSNTAVFFAANGRAAVQLHAAGLIDSGASDVVIVHSTEPVAPSVRSSRGRFGRAGRPTVREVDMSGLLGSSNDLAALRDGFRQAAAL